MRRHLASVAGVILATALLALVCRSRADEIKRALDLVPVEALLVLAGLHVLTLFARSEASRLALSAVQDEMPSRQAVHAANAGAFLVGSLESHSALAARVVLLRRFAGRRAPRADQILLTDAPIFLLEMIATALVLCFVTPFGLALLGIAVLVLLAGRRLRLRGLRVLRHGLPTLAAWAALISAAGVARVAIALAVCGVVPTVERVGTAFTAAGAYALLPLGPGAPAAATVTAAGTDALAAGLVLAATSIAAVLAYAALIATSRLVDLRPARG